MKSRSFMLCTLLTALGAGQGTHARDGQGTTNWLARAASDLVAMGEDNSVRLLRALWEAEYDPVETGFPPSVVYDWGGYMNLRIPRMCQALFLLTFKADDGVMAPSRIVVDEQDHARMRVLSDTYPVLLVEGTPFWVGDIHPWHPPSPPGRGRRC